MTDFAARHIGPSEAAQRQMLGRLGYASLDELIRAALPEGMGPEGMGPEGMGPKEWGPKELRNRSSACPPRCPSRRRWPSCAGWPAGTRCSPR